MRYLFKVAGIVLAAIFVVSMVASATASASKYEHCVTGAALTKYTTANCATTSPTGTFGWKELSGTDAIRIKGSLLMIDKETILGVSEVECSGETIGFIGPEKFGQVTKIEVSPAQCRGIKNCTKVEAVEARNLPWQTELFETGGVQKVKITSGTGGQPGWSMTCKVLVNFTDECLQVAGKEETITLTNTDSAGEQLVLQKFDNANKAKCSQSGGKESGEVKGSQALLLATKAGLRITP